MRASRGVWRRRADATTRARGVASRARRIRGGITTNDDCCRAARRRRRVRARGAEVNSSRRTSVLIFGSASGYSRSLRCCLTPPQLMVGRLRRGRGSRCQRKRFGRRKKAPRTPNARCAEKTRDATRPKRQRRRARAISRDDGHAREGLTCVRVFEGGDGALCVCPLRASGRCFFRSAKLLWRVDSNENLDHRCPSFLLSERAFRVCYYKQVFVFVFVFVLCHSCVIPPLKSSLSHALRRFLDFCSRCL